MPLSERSQEAAAYTETNAEWTAKRAKASGPRFDAKARQGTTCNETPAKAELTREGAENVIATVGLPGAGKVDDHMDASVYDTLRNEGFFDAMAQKYPVP